MAEIRYKLTNEGGHTYFGTEWGEGFAHETSGNGDLCGPGWLHCYPDPILAVLLNPIHANFPTPRLCEVAVSGRQKTDRGLKEGWTRMEFVRWLPVPEVALEHRIRFAVLCGLAVYKNKSWREWAQNWLNGTDRSKGAADAAAVAARAAAYAAADAAYAARAAYAAADAAADAAYAAYAAADAAAYAAYAAYAAADLDLIALAHQAVENTATV